jgi:hypothetical protein
MAAVTATTELSTAEAAIANRALARIGAEFIRDTTEDTPSNRQCKVAFPQTRDELLRDYEFNFAQRMMTLVEDVGTTISTASLATSTTVTWGATQVVNAHVGKSITAASGIPADTVVISNTASVGIMSKAATSTGAMAVVLTWPKEPWEHIFLLPTAPVILKILDIAGNVDNRYQVMGSGATRRILCNTESSDGFLEVRFIEQVTDTTAWDSMFTDAFVLRLASKLAVPLIKRPDMAQFLQQEFAAIYSLAKKASSEEAVLQEVPPLWTERNSGTVE